MAQQSRHEGQGQITSFADRTQRGQPLMDTKKLKERLTLALEEYNYKIKTRNEEARLSGPLVSKKILLFPLQLSLTLA